MKENILSIFIDESGDFGPYEHHTPYYLVAMVLHDQSVSIESNIQELSQHVHNLGYPDHAIHTGPLIRRESIYCNDRMGERKKLFNALFNFTRKLDFHYLCVPLKKSECKDVVMMTAKLSRAIAIALQGRMSYFEQFDRIILYYDNGQVELTRILTSVFNILFSHAEFRKVRPVDYKLFQVADLICTIELLNLKSEINVLSNSEKEFFGTVRDFKKNYQKPLKKKVLD